VQTFHEQLDPKANPKLMSIKTVTNFFKGNWQTVTKTKEVAEI
jgi:hypothetical protein